MKHGVMHFPLSISLEGLHNVVDTPMLYVLLCMLYYESGTLLHYWAGTLLYYVLHYVIFILLRTPDAARGRV